MDDIGFKGEAVFSNSQLLTLGMVLFIVLIIWLFIQKNKDFMVNWLSKHNTSKRYNIEIQRVDSQSYLYQINDENHRFLVFRSQDGVVLLDKQIVDNNN